MGKTSGTWLSDYDAAILRRIAQERRWSMSQTIIECVRTSRMYRKAARNGECKKARVKHD